MDHQRNHCTCGVYYNVAKKECSILAAVIPNILEAQLTVMPSGLVDIRRSQC
ncbi:MAG: hypothetical protein Q4G58_15940 [bacterium]|nr:hypothetical protein [bacterium]